ncbi:helix-turn-helix domain-containing protein [Streptomyces sp. SAS_270]|uniref:helix-turn-helix domain-containing protein n=1 Tax=Streptomyces sp. SAS_270 TaxID=3412748 RepID=UPI00403C398F
MPTGDDEVEELAALLRQLKARTDRSYGSLARRLNMNTSTLHRYCAGEAVPLEFAPLERFAALCGASSDERLELHRRWIPAVAARQRPRQGETPADRTAAATPGTPLPATDPPEIPEAPATSEIPKVPETSTAPDPSAILSVREAPEAPETPEARESLEREPAPSTRPHANSRSHPRPWYRGRLALTVAGASALLAVLAALPAFSTDAPSSPKAPTPHRSTPAHPTTSASPTAPAPLTWTADSQAWEIDCDHDYVIRKQPRQVPPPPAEQDAAAWAATQDAVHGRETLVQIAVQGRNSTAVVLKALRVRVVGRDTPLQGTAYSMAQGCGGDMTPRAFSIDLDAHRPTVHPVAGSDGYGKPVPAMRMPYRVSAKDPEMLVVKALTEDCDCRWYLELEWSSEGRTGTVRIDDDGRPFRTSGIKGLPRYWYAGRHWTPVVT